MKLVADMLKKMRPLFSEGGRFAKLAPIFQAADNFFFSHPATTATAPYGRDAIDVKRYMSLVILALLPCLLASLYFFGPRVLLMMLVSYVVGGTIEVLFAIVRKEEINEGLLVTGFIFPLILPPALPLWMVGVGVAFGVLVGKEVFGGTGRNLFNPAILGRCFLAIGFPSVMATTWVRPGAATWGNVLAGWVIPPDAITSATPLALAKKADYAPLWNLFLGNIPGCAGETSAIAILVGGLFLVAVGVANWRTVAAVLGSFTLLNVILHAAAPQAVAPVLFNLLSGGLLFGAFFMATDPVTGPVTLAGKWVFGILIGVITLLIRSFSGYVEGVMFAILFANICAPMIDDVVIKLKCRRYALER